MKVIVTLVCTLICYSLSLAQAQRTHSTAPPDSATVFVKKAPAGGGKSLLSGGFGTPPLWTSKVKPQIKVPKSDLASLKTRTLSWQISYEYMTPKTKTTFGLQLARDVVSVDAKNLPYRHKVGSTSTPIANTGDPWLDFWVTLAFATTADPIYEYLPTSFQYTIARTNVALRWTQPYLTNPDNTVHLYGGLRGGFSFWKTEAKGGLHYKDAILQHAPKYNRFSERTTLPSIQLIPVGIRWQAKPSLFFYSEMGVGTPSATSVGMSYCW